MLTILKAKDLKLEVNPNDIQSVKVDATRAFYFEGIPTEVRLTDVSQVQLIELERAIEERSVRAVWNPKVCDTF